MERLLYVDTDTLFMGSLEHIWAVYDNFNDSQIAALAWEHEDGSTGWYEKHDKIPHYLPYG